MSFTVKTFNENVFIHSFLPSPPPSLAPQISASNFPLAFEVLIAEEAVANVHFGPGHHQAGHPLSQLSQEIFRGAVQQCLEGAWSRRAPYNLLQNCPKSGEEMSVCQR